jgi:serine protease Do
MDENKNYTPESWDSGIYGTGKTRPPKSHNGIITLLLVLVIFLSGLVSFLGLLNVRLFAQLKSLPEQPVQEPVSFVSEEAEEHLPQLQDLEETTAPTEALAVSDGDTIFLNPSPEAAPNIPQQVGLSLQDIYEKAIPSVVSISCTGSNATGTGVVMTASGYIVTNHHVVEGAREITVLLNDQRKLEATLVGGDSVSDLAVLHVDAPDLSPAEFGDSGVLRVGDSVVAIGDPLGIELRGTMTNGIVSAINRDVTTGGRTLTLIQTNAALNSGNSGGPLINCYGQVVGINTLKIGGFSSDTTVEGLGFAIPSTTVKEIVDQLIRQGYVSGRPSLGFVGESVSSFYQYYYRLPAGLYITQLDPESDAAAKGLVEGDILLSIDDTRITALDELTAALSQKNVGDTVRIIIFRSGRQYSADITLQEHKG